MSYMCDRARSITWGIEGGLPSIPLGVWLTRDDEETFLGAVFSNVPCEAGDRFTRPSARSGGFGDPLDRDPIAGRGDVTECYVSGEGGSKDYGVVIRELDGELCEYKIDGGATSAERERIRAERRRWLEEDPESVAERYRRGEVDQLDVIRRHGVVLDWGTGELLPHSTEQFRAMLGRRMVPHWASARWSG